MEFWIWMVIGLVLCGAELMTGAFVMLILGVGAIFTGIVELIYPLDNVYIQLTLFVVFSGICAVIVYFLFKRRRGISIGQSKQFLGEVGLITQGFDPENFPNQFGEVRFQKPILGADTWECRSKSNKKLKNGDRVRLIDFQGKVVLVELN